MDKKKIWISVFLIVAPLMGFAIQQIADSKTQEESEPKITVEEEKIDPEWVRGFNAAIRQFASAERAENLTIRTQKTKPYASYKEGQSKTAPKPKESSGHESQYAMGYHQALDIMYQGVICPKQ